MSDDILRRIDDVLGEGMTAEWDPMVGPDAMRSRPMPTHMVINRNRTQDEADQVGDIVEVYELGQPQPAADPAMFAWRDTRGPAIAGERSHDPTPPHHGVRWAIIDTLGLEPVLAAAVARIQALIDWATGWRRRRWGRKHPSRTITVDILGDTREFVEGMRRASAAIANLGLTALEAESAMARFAALWRAWSKAELQSTSMRQASDHAEMQRVADRERQQLDTWWQHHLDNLYADLGMERTK